MWLTAVGGFGGMRDHGDKLVFAPRPPGQLTRLSFGLLYRGRRLRVEVAADEARYELLEGEDLEVIHHGEEITVTAGPPQAHALPPVEERPAPEPPPGRMPQRRHRDASEDGSGGRR